MDKQSKVLQLKIELLRYKLSDRYEAAKKRQHPNHKKLSGFMKGLRATMLLMDEMFKEELVDVSRDD